MYVGSPLSTHPDKVKYSCLHWQKVVGS